MKSTVVYGFLILVMLSSHCYGNIVTDCSDDIHANCSTPTFVNATCSPTYKCYFYGTRPAIVGQDVTLNVIVSDDVTLTWWIVMDDQKVNISCGHPSLPYQCSFIDDHKTLIWKSVSAGSTIFYVNATNGCGMSTACQVVHPDCQSCIDCPKLPRYPTNRTVTVPEHTTKEFHVSVTAQRSLTILEWCSVGSNNSMCCSCDDSKCSQTDWRVVAPDPPECDYNYSCSLIISNMSLSYNHRTIYSRVRSPGRNGDISYIYIEVSQDSSKHKLKPVYKITGGCGLLVLAAIVIVVFVLVVYLIRSHRRRSVMLGVYEPLPNSPLRRVLDDDDDDDVTSQCLDSSVDIRYQNV